MHRSGHCVARPVMLVRADTRDAGFQGGSSGHEDERRTDFTLLRQQLDVRVVDLKDVSASWLGRLVQALLGRYVALAFMAFRLWGSASVYLTWSENEAIALALLLKLVGARVPIVAVGHYPAKPEKWLAWQLAQVHRQLYRVLPLGTAQAERLTNGLRVPRSKVEMLPFGIDTRYWDPRRARPRRSQRPYVFAAGLQHRDYPTLVTAMEGLDADLLIGAASPWSTTGNELEGKPLPDQVRVESPDLAQLRDAYAGAAVVVVPLVETDFPAGTTVILEAMAMQRPVVVARSEGTGDYVADRRKVLRKGPHRATSAPYSSRLASAGVQGQTGVYFPPGVADELRKILRWTLEHPTEAATIGARGRRVVEEIHTLEDYAGQIAAAVRGAVLDHQNRCRSAHADAVSTATPQAQV